MTNIKRPTNLHESLVQNFKSLGWPPIWAYIFFITGLGWHEHRWGSLANLLLFPLAFVIWTLLDLIVIGLRLRKSRKQARKAQKSAEHAAKNAEYARLAEASTGIYRGKVWEPLPYVPDDNNFHGDDEKSTEIRSDWKIGWDQGFIEGRKDFAAQIHPTIVEMNRRLDDLVLVPRADWDKFVRVVDVRDPWGPNAAAIKRLLGKVNV